MSARGRIGCFVRGVAIHEFIRDRICTWQPELLVIKTQRSPFVPGFSDSPESEAESKGFSGRPRRRIMYAEEAIRASATLSPFPPKHVSLERVQLSAPPGTFVPLRWIFFYSSDYRRRRVRDRAEWPRRVSS